MYLQENLRREATVPWNSQEFWLTSERLELLGDSHLEVETRSRDLDTVNNSRFNLLNNIGRVFMDYATL